MFEFPSCCHNAVQLVYLLHLIYCVV